MMIKKQKITTVFILACILLAGCREEYEIIYSSRTKTSVGQENTGNLMGFYLLNEGNMGSNKASLDYFDFSTGVYHRDIYAEANPNVVKELGDVGNDIQIYGSKLYAVLNVSNYIEVMDAKTARHMGKIEIPNVRYIQFYNGKAYASSYVAPVQFDQNARVGYVAEIDTATLQVTRTVNVGYQPEELAVVNDRIYVANSGGYMFPNYDRTVSVIDLETFKEVKKIDVAINLHRLRVTPYNELVVSSRGNHYNEPSKLYFIDLETEEVNGSLNMAVSNLDLVGDSAYVYAVEWNHNTRMNTVTYGIFNVRTKKVVSRNFITDGTDKDIVTPHGVKVNPSTRDIYVADAIDYVTPGTLVCYNKFGKLKWKVDTGDIPGHIVFLYE